MKSSRRQAGLTAEKKHEKKKVAGLGSDEANRDDQGHLIDVSLRIQGGARLDLWFLLYNHIITFVFWV